MSAEPNVEVPSNPDPALPSKSEKPLDSDVLNNIPVEPEMPGAKTSSSPSSSSPSHDLVPSSLSNIPRSAKSYISKTDEAIARLNTLLKTPGGLASFLSTTNYSLYTLVYLHLNAPTRAQVITYISRLVGRTSTPKFAPEQLNPSQAPTSPLQPAAGMVRDLRTTLRLVGLVPMYVGLRGLLRRTLLAVRGKEKIADPVMHTISIVQLLGYITFQIFENITHLADKGIVSRAWVNKQGGATKLGLISCRGWAVGITADFARLFREARLQRGARRRSGKGGVERTAEEKQQDEKWWSEFAVAASWFPMALHYSSPNGIGLNLGMIGLCGLSANLGAFLRTWEATKKT